MGTYTFKEFKRIMSTNYEGDSFLELYNPIFKYIEQKSKDKIKYVIESNTEDLTKGAFFLNSILMDYLSSATKVETFSGLESDFNLYRKEIEGDVVWFLDSSIPGIDAIEIYITSKIYFPFADEIE